jgi:ubiquinone/menaquinone biosynthesis C-methylase UbiE
MITISYTSSCATPSHHRHLPKTGNILQVGVGTSAIQSDMVTDGYQHIINTDYSPVAIQRLQEIHRDIPQLSYEVADARSMPQYQDNSFQGVLDKGTLDALLCGELEEADSRAMLREVWRVLAPGAAYVMVTSGE